MEIKGVQQFFDSYGFKMVVVSVLAILLLIPSFLIQEIISERISLSEQVQDELYAQWGGKQVVAGPVLNIPYTIVESGQSNTGMAERHGVVHFLPETVMADGMLFPETRQRGMYEVVVYGATLLMKGIFAPPDVSLLDLQHVRYHWDAAYFTIGVSDMRGLRNIPLLLVNGQQHEVEPGVADTDVFESGMTIRAGLIDLAQPFHFEIELLLNGSEDLSVGVLGKTSEVRMGSDWVHPRFSGAFLPGERQVSSDGFTATWQVTHLNRNFPQQWVGNKFNTQEAVVGVELLIPVDHYQKSMRSVKYAILFIALNFIVFIFIELHGKTRIHPFQYTLVAFALLLFYALLTSLGEHIGFNMAYLVSAVTITALISWYAVSVLGERRLVIRVGLLQAGLYVFLFVLLQLQDYALLTGSIGLFVILAAIMGASRGIRWYRQG
jgi:inner membrane protein